MRIESPSSTRAAGATRRNERGTGVRTGEFGRLLEGAASGETSAPAAVHGVVALDPLLIAQGADDREAKGRAARERAVDLLDRLDELRLGLLSGSLSPATLRELTALARARRAGEIDPRLRAVLDDIELRAAVELAKLEQAGVAI